MHTLADEKQALEDSAMLILSAVLNTPYAAKSGQRGGTIIAESVREVEEHRRLVESGGYRPEGCPRCGRFLHAFGQRQRKLRDLSGSTTQESICRYRCRPCRAVWQVLPGFIARHLHRTWDVVQTALAELSSPQRPATRATSTLRRWRGRLASSAVVLIQAMLGGRGVGRIAFAGGWDSMYPQRVGRFAGAGRSDR